MTLQCPTTFVILASLVAAASAVYCAVLDHDVLDNLNCGCKESEQKIEDNSDTFTACFVCGLVKVSALSQLCDGLGQKLGRTIRKGPF